jgi:hypothetical protein
MNIETASIKITQNINLLEVGKKYMYKDLCEILEIVPTVKANSSREAQLKDIRQYVLLEKLGRGFVVIEFYDTIQFKLDNRGESVSYSNAIQLLLLNVLSVGVSMQDNRIQGIRKGRMVQGKNALLREMSMINHAYSSYKREPIELARRLDIGVYDIREWYDLNGKTIQNQLESALNKLSNKALVLWSEVKIMCFVNEDGYSNHRVADEMEAYQIMNAERTALKSLGYDNKSIVVRASQWDLFSRCVLTELKTDVTFQDLEYIYKGYDVSYNYDNVDDEIYKLSQEEYKTNKYIVNEGVRVNIQERAVIRHERDVELGKEMSVNSKTGNEYLNIRYSEKYVPNSDKITEHLVSVSD